jgi:hypothetical protein
VPYAQGLGVPNMTFGYTSSCATRGSRPIRLRAREYLHHVDTFVGAEEVQEIFFLRDQNRALIKLVAELKAENRRLRKKDGKD